MELFSASVAENIARLGEVDPPSAVAAAQRANAHTFVLSLADGYDTQLGEDGCLISAGQRQRIALARALYGSPRLLVLDEPNSNLDSEGELALLDAMTVMKAAGVTLVLITHRPALLAVATKVLVLREGTVDAFGPPAEILGRVTGRPVQAGPLKVVEAG